MKALSILPAFLAAFLTGIVPAHAQDAHPPIATPAPDYFVDEIEVSFEPADDVIGLIRYDSNSTAPWDYLDAKPYTGPITVNATTTFRAQTGLGGQVGTYTYTKDRAPTATLTTPVANATLRRDAAVNLTASATDPDGHAVTVTYQYVAGTSTVWQTIAGTPTGPSHALAWTPTVASAYKLRAVATDPYGMQGISAEVSVTVTLPNQPPMVTLTNPSNGAQFTSGQSILISVNANDQDDVGGGITKLELFHNDTLITTLFTPPYQYNWTTAAIGTHVLQAKALDNNNPPAAGVSSTPTITVLAKNKKPSISLASSSPGPFTEPASFRLTASPVDTDGAITSVAFFRNGTQLVRLNAPPWQYDAQGVSAGTYAFTAMAWDNHSVGGNPAPDSTLSAALNISVSSHLPPTVSIGKDTTVVLPTNTVILRSQGTDPEGTTVTYAWTAPAGATLSNAAAQNPTATLSGPGEYTFNLTVTDGGSPAKSATAKIKVTVQAKPAITSSLAETATVGTFYSYTMAASGTPTPAFTVSGLPAWLNRPAGANVLSGTPPANAGGSANITLTATNAVGNDQKVMVLTIREAARITQEMKDTVTVQERSRAVLSVVATGTPAPTFTWQQLPDGGGAPIAVGGNSPTLTFDTVAVNKTGTYRVIVKNVVNPPDTSKPCRLEVKAALRIQTQPVRTEVMVGRRATLRAKATGAGPILYQWFRGNVSVGPKAAKDSTLILDPVQLNQSGLYRARITNDFSDTNTAGTFLWTDTARLIVNQPKVDKPKANPAAPADFGFGGLTVTLAVDTPGASIRYTLNGADPTTPTSGLAYDATNKIKVTENTVIRARAFKDNYLPSDLFQGTYTFVDPGNAAKPTAKPIKATFATTILCTLTTSTSGGKIKYTTDGKDPRTSGIDYQGPFLIKSTTTVSAYAYADKIKDSDTLLKVYTLDNPIPRAPTPGVTPAGKKFTLSQSVTFTSPLDSVVIRYTTDGSSPDSSATVQTTSKNVPLPPFTRTTVLKAILTRNGYSPSDMITQTYTLLPGPIEATPAPVGGTYTFKETQKVTLKVTPAAADIWYTINDSLPLDDLNRPTADAKKYDANDGILLASTYTIAAQAVSDSVASDVYRFSYTKEGGPLPTPQVTTSNGSYSFKDTLRITLVRPMGADIRFTRDGTDPTAASEKYEQPFTIDSSMTLQAIALGTGYQPSRILVAKFTLVADKPTADPAGGGYFAPPTVALTAPSRKTPIWYTTDGTLPVPGSGTATRYVSPFTLGGSTLLKAVAYSGDVPGPLYEQEYSIYSTAKDTILHPGETFFLVGGLSLSNPAGQSAAVRVKQGAPDSKSLAGFSSVQFNLILSEVEGSADGFPEVVLSRSASEGRSLFKLQEDGKIYFISSDPEVRLSEPGTYFTGLDNKLPVITYVGETINDSGYTVVRFKVTDNVTNLFYNTLRNDNPALNASRVQVLSGADLDFRLKHAPGVLKPLYLQLSVNDYSNAAYCPPDGQSFLSLSQDMRNLKGPDSWRVGGSAALPHDLVGIPLDAKPALTLGDLRDSRNGRVEALVYQQGGSTKWRKLAQTDPLVPGQAYWIGASAALKGLNRATLRTNPMGMGKFNVRLKTGWNQVANPHLETLYWPFARTLGDHYRAATIKGLWAYDPANPRVYVETDSLEPWKGYYVYNYTKDTTVELLTRPVLKPVQKKEGASWEAGIALGYGDAPQVRLGAAPGGNDAAGRDDEGVLPSLAGRNRFKAVRDGRSLSTDWIRLDRDRILKWRVLPLASEETDALPIGGPGPAVQVLSQDLPDGYEAWALSRLRGMKFRLEEGSSLPASGLPEDTLLVVAGPAAKLADLSMLKDLAENAPALDLRVLDRGAGPEMILDLPVRSAVRASLWTVRGTSLGRLERTLPGGRYHFGLARDLAGAARLPGSGLALLRVEVRGPNGPAYLVRKVLFKP